MRTAALPSYKLKMPTFYIYPFEKKKFRVLEIIFYISVAQYW